MSNDTPNSGSSRNNDLASLIAKIENETTRDYLNVRVVKQMDYFSQTSRKCKKRYQVLMTVSIICSGLIPIITIATNDQASFTQYFLAALASVVTGINAWLAMDHTRELWLTYRQKREQLLSEIYCYLNRIGPYANQTDPDKCLTSHCERILTDEQIGWMDLQREG